MMTANSEKAGALFPKPVGFSVEYFDPVANSLRAFVLTVFPDRKVQMVYGDKIFLSKTYAKDLDPTDLYIGGTVVLFSRELSILDYADESTRKYFEGVQSRGFVLILPSAMDRLGEIVSLIQGGGGDSGGSGRKNRGPSVISNAKMFRLDGRKRRLPQVPLLDSVPPQSGFAVALEVILDSQNGGFEGLQDVIDGWDGDGVHASGTPVEAAEHARCFFQRGAEHQNQEQTGNSSGINDTGEACTLCVVKPHVVREGKLGWLLSLVAQRGFEVAGLQMVNLGEAGAEELLRPYRGVVPYHAASVGHLKSGPCVAIKVQGGEKVVEEFREACGPADPDVARALYPESLRALLGLQQATNAVHCTDLPEDGLLECQYMFDVLAKGREGP